MASRLERLVSLDAYIRAGHYPSVRKLCDTFEVQPRTIYGDLRELKEMFGLDIRYDKDRNGYYNADPSKQLPQLAMTYEEALLITLAIEMLASSFGPSFRGALTRASEMVRSNDHGHFRWISDLVELENRASCEIKCSVLTAVLHAATRGEEAKLILSESKRKPISAVPVRVVYSDGHWHLLSREKGKSKRVRNNGDDFDGPLEPGLFATRLCTVDEVELNGKED